MFCIGSIFFFCKQKTAYELRISDWSSDVCSSDLSPHRSDLGFLHPQHCCCSCRCSSRLIAFAACPDGSLSQRSGSVLFAGPPMSTRSEEPTSELKSLMRTSYAVFYLKKKTLYVTFHSTPYIIIPHTPYTHTYIF